MYNTIRNTICMTNGITLRMEGGAMRHSDISSAIGAQRRVPVSLRVPADLADEVDGFAREHGVRKTDAYLFLIKKGLQRGGDEDGCEGADARVGEYRALLDDLSALLQAPVSAAREAQKVREAVAEAASLFPAIERAYLFGSFARGSQTAGSDVDVRLVIDRGEGFTLRELSHFAKIVQQETGRECDVVSAADVANEALAAAIDREKVLVYERKTD